MIDTERCYLQVDCPPDGYDLLVVSQGEAARLARIRDEAINNNEWEMAAPIRFNPSEELFLAYWLEKSRHPIMRPLRGHEDLEQHFAHCRRFSYSLNSGRKGDIVISAVGDLMCTKGLEQSANQLYEDTASLIFDSDCAFANLESTFSDSEIVPLSFSSEASPKINLNQAQYETLMFHKGKQYQIVQIANNHILDSGEAGAKKTMSQLDRDHIRHIGVNETEEESRKAPVMEIKGIRIGWVGHTFSVNGRPLPEGKPWFINLTPFHTDDTPDLGMLLTQIKFCKEAKCDLIIASMHWGLEFELYPHPQQRQWAQIMADNGVDLILGHHPHMIQFSEIIHPVSQPEKDVPVLYSLGNLTPVFSSPETALSLIARIDAAKTENGVELTGLKLFPTAILRESRNGTTAVKTKLLKDLLSYSDHGRMEAYIKKMVSIADKVIGEGWRS